MEAGDVHSIVDGKETDAMSIGIVVRAFPLLSETFVINLITGLLDAGHNVRIICFYGFKDEGEAHPVVHRYQLMKRAIRYCSTPDGRFAGFQDAQGQMHKRIDCDVLHCQYGPIGLIASKMRDAGLFRGRLITHFRGHDMTANIQARGEGVYTLLFQKGDYFLTNCRKFADRLVQIGCPPAKLSIIGSAIDLKSFPYMEKRVRGRVLRLTSVARLVEKKGIEFGIRAAAMLLRQGLPLRYHIIGDGPLGPSLQQLINSLGVNNEVRLRGRCDQPGVVRELDETDIFIAPCVRAADGDEDATTNTLKEAMAMGLPVIGTHCGALPELVEHKVQGLLVPQRDPAAIVEAVQELVAHEERWPEMGLAGRKRAEEFDVPAINAQMIRTYRKVLNGSI